MKDHPIFVKLMIFDLDGTLLDSRRDIILSVMATLRHFGFPEKSDEQISSYIGWGSVKLVEDALGTTESGAVAPAVDFYWKHYRENSLKHTKPFAGALDMLSFFSEKTKVIVSNKAREFVLRELMAFDMQKYFVKIIGGDNVKCAKPSPCPVNDLLREFAAAKEEAIMIGDMALDVQTGKAAGIRTCAVDFGIGDKGELMAAGPDMVISGLHELKDILR